MVRSDTGVKSCCGHRLFAHWARSHSRDLGFSRLAFSRLPRACLSREARSPAPECGIFESCRRSSETRQPDRMNSGILWRSCRGSSHGTSSLAAMPACTYGLAEQRADAHDLTAPAAGRITQTRATPWPFLSYTPPELPGAGFIEMPSPGSASWPRPQLPDSLPLTAAMRTMPCSSVQPRRRKPCVCSGLPWSSRCAHQR